MERKNLLLKFIVENYIERAEPVGSKFLVENGELEVSGATIRNEMNALEKDGLLTHPHTSAGRIPTQAGFKYYLENLMKPLKIKKKYEEDIERILKDTIEFKNKMKELAKYISLVTGNAILLAHDKDSVYYTGISSLFSQPEFRDHVHTVNMSVLFDQCEDHLDDLYDHIGGEVKTLLGEENPLGAFCGLAGVRFGEEGLLVVLGPVRMDYGKTVGLLEYIKNLKM